jgi:hypothetical protein
VDACFCLGMLLMFETGLPLRFGQVAVTFAQVSCIEGSSSAAIFGEAGFIPLLNVKTS